MNIGDIIGIILGTIVPVIAFMGWVYHRIDKKFDKVDERFEKMEQKFVGLENKFDSKIDALDKKFDSKIDALDKKFESKFDFLSHDIRDLSKDVQSIDSRVARIEGQLNAPYHWEPKVKEKEE